jgi:hypothetical protein
VSRIANKVFGQIQYATLMYADMYADMYAGAYAVKEVNGID